MAQIERPPWRYRTRKAREERNTGIREKWEMGWSRQKIAEFYGITPVRVGQIMEAFGESFREWD